MPLDNIDDDDYIAKILSRDAKSAAKEYELVGIDAFNPKRSRSGAPKPNTNFLRNIIRQTDSHNAALLAKEAEESRARLNGMNGGVERRRGRDDRTHGRGTSKTPPLDGDERRHKRRRRDYSDGEGSRDRRRRRRERDERDRSRDTRDKRERRKGERKYDESDRDEGKHRKSKHSRHHCERERRHRNRYSSEETRERSSHKERDDRSHRGRRHSSTSASPPPKSDRKSSRHRKSPSPKRRLPSPKRTTDNKKSSERCSPSPASDSDPLEAIVGPIPPSKSPPVRSRGRGAHKANSMGIDSRFSSTYDPTADVQVDDDIDDDFGDALEAYRDRQKWKAQGSVRLKEAGFTDAQIKKWKKGDELGEEDVVWTRQGQKREWDRNKVLDEDGETEVVSTFGRLT